MTPLLTILCITYNHEKYIAEALDSFICQETSFPFEVLIGDDCSTDSTVTIVKQYMQKHNNIRLLQRDKNLGVNKNFYDTASHIKSKYVALCEGDDYWIDSNKLQKQVDFLEKNPNVTLCFHPVNVVDEKGELQYIYPDLHKLNNHKLNFDYLLKENFIQTNSVVYRWCFDSFKAKLENCEMLPLDHIYHLFHARQGNIALLNDVMSVYRKNSGGVWFNIFTSNWYRKYGLLFLNYLYFMHNEFGLDNDTEIKKFQVCLVYLGCREATSNFDKLCIKFSRYCKSNLLYKIFMKVTSLISKILPRKQKDYLRAFRGAVRSIRALQEEHHEKY